MPVLPKEKLEKLFGIIGTILGTLLLAVGSWSATTLKDMATDIKNISQTTAVLTALRTADQEALHRLESRIDSLEDSLRQLKR